VFVLVGVFVGSGVVNGVFSLVGIFGSKGLVLV